MQISPLVPVVGLVLIVANVLIAALRPTAPPKLMGLQLYIGGLTTILISVVDLLNPIGIGGFERLLLFLSGFINCSVGYYMALREIQKQGG